MLKFYSCFLVISLIVINSVFANDLSISNTGLAGRNVSAGANNPNNFVFVKFDISWDNSWRTDSVPGNWDAAWVFIKYRIGSGMWHHATLASTDYVEPAGSKITPSSDGKGIFIYKSTTDTISGPVSYNGVKIRWNYGLDGVADSSAVTIKVIGIEMVYVPTDSFYLGSGGEEPGSFTEGSRRTGNGIVFKVTSENQINIDSSAGNLWGISSNPGYDDIGPVGILPTAFPKGYQAFYCMKYSISQKQYADFLNMLTYDQQDTRTAVSPSSAAGTIAMTTNSPGRNGIKIEIPGVSNTVPAVYGCDLNDNGIYNESDDGQDIACNWLSWGDGIAYSDWAALRPMTELEFEKACRGPKYPVQYEYIWGTIGLVHPTGITNSGSNNESVTPDSANASYGGYLTGAVRVGIFARSNTTRVTAGAAYYGILDMGGDVVERTITVGNAAGRSFQGTHGDGELSSAGEQVGNVDWPGIDGLGGGFRGGLYDSQSERMMISDRYIGAFASSERGSGVGTRGFRAVRSEQ
jgi:formylglycine-generating enzyme required for sulfatase activity